MVHSAKWTPAMAADFPGNAKSVCQNRMRCYGYGVPNLDRALWCARNALCLVSQAEVQPYERPGGNKGTVKTKEMHLYELPWPIAELRGLGEQEVTMRVTLSYFIEPSPGRRGWKYKHRYASHGLRFDVKRPTETVDDFRKRLNKQAREEDDDIVSTESQEWTLGIQLRSRGSLHSDWWTGTASDLADCGHIGIYPVVGWWRERPQFERYNRSVRYSLVVAINTPAENADGRAQVPAQRLVDLGPEPPVAENQRNRLDQLIPLEPGPAPRGLTKRGHDFVGLKLSVPVDAAVALLEPVGVPGDLVVDQPIAVVLKV